MKAIKNNKIYKSIFVLILFFYVNLFGLITPNMLNINIEKITMTQKSIILLLNNLILAIILVLIYRKDLLNSFKKAKENFNQFFEDSFKSWFVGLILMMVSNILIVVLLPKAISTNENAVQEMIKVSPYLLLITAGILGPIVEELVFRKSFKDIIKNKYVFIILSSFVFGALHVIFSAQKPLDLVYFFPYFFLGLSFAHMVNKTNNDLSSIMMHMTHNTILVLLSIFTR